MKAATPHLCIATAFLSIVVLSGCGETPNTGHNGETHVITLRDWPDQNITGCDAEVANRQHLSIDKKAVDVWTTWGRGDVFSRVQIDIGFRDHTRDEFKNWKVKIACPTIWPHFTTATIKIADGLFAQHPDYKNGVVVFYEGREFHNGFEPGWHPALKVGSHTITVEILDEQDRVKGLATFPMTVLDPLGQGGP